MTLFEIINARRIARECAAGDHARVERLICSYVRCIDCGAAVSVAQAFRKREAA